MIKKVIFDLDNTLIINPDNCMDNYQIVIDKYSMNTNVLELYDVIGEYEEMTTKYKREELLNVINNHYKTNYGIQLVDDIIDCVGMWTYPAPSNVVDTLKYLSSKYELYVLTNWFYKSQTDRLKGANILEYFKEVKSAEEYTKPVKEAYEQFFCDCKPSECVIIGDSYKMDIEVPNKLGMNTILYNSMNKDIDYNGKIIYKFEELKDLL